MSRRAITLLLVGALLAARPSDQPLYWTGTLTLIQAVQRARMANFPARMAQADAAATAARAAGVRAGLFPEIDVSGTTMNGGITQLGFPLVQQSYLSAMASLPLFVPSTSALARGAARSARAARFDAIAAQNRAALQAAQSYEGALLAEAVFEARTLTLRYEQRHVNDVRIRVIAGDLPRYQLLESEAALASAKQSLEDAAASRDEALANLEVTLDFSLDSRLQLVDRLRPLHLPESERRFMQRAAAQRPEILAARSALGAARAGLASARARYLPTVTGSMQMYNGHSNPNLGSTGYQVGVTATVPILDGGSRPALVHERAAAVDRARLVLQQAQLSTQRDVANAWREYQAARSNAQSAKTQAANAAQALHIAIIRERAGKGIILETLFTLAADAGARENVLKSITRLNDAVVAVHYAAGDTTNLSR